MSFLSFIYPCQSQLLSVQTGWDDAQSKAAAGPAHSQRFTLRTVQASSDPDVAPVWPLDLLFFVHFTETSLGSTKKIRKYRGQSVFRYWHRHTFDWFNFSFEHTYINIHLRSWKLTLQLIYYSFAPFSGFHVPVAVSGWNVIRLDAADLNRTWDLIDLKKTLCVPVINDLTISGFYAAVIVCVAVSQLWPYTSFTIIHPNSTTVSTLNRFQCSATKH